MNRKRMMVVIGIFGAAVALTMHLSRRADTAAAGAGAAGAPGAGASPRVTVADDEAGATPTPALALSRRDDDPEGVLRLEGQVVDADEVPVGGAIVTLDASPPRTVITEQDGSFVAAGLLPRVYRLEARAGETVAGPLGVRVSAGVEPVVLRLRAAAAVEVTVLAGGRPLAGATVELRALGVRAAATDADGTARFAGTGAGAYVVNASAAGFAPAWELCDVGAAPGVTHRKTMTLVAGVAVTGRVVDEQGRPVADARVTHVEAAALVPFIDARRDGVVSGDDGRFRLTVTPGTHRFFAAAAGHAPGGSGPVTLAADGAPAEVVIVVGRGGRLAGRVQDRHGAPVAYATVRVAAEGGDAAEGPREALCDEQGRFALDGLPRRALILVASHEASSSATVAVDLTARATHEDLLVPLDRDAVITGVVVNADGAPVAEAQIDARALTGDDGTRPDRRLRGALSAVADQAGRFTLGGLAAGRYALAALAPGASGEAAPAMLRPAAIAAAGDDGVVLVVSAFPAVRGRLEFEDGSGPAAFTVTLGNARPVPFVGDGAFVLTDVPPGRYRLVANGPGFVPMVLPEIVLPERDLDLGPLRVTRGRTITGRVRDADGAAVAGATVVAGPRLLGDGNRITARELGGLQATQETTTAADGSFELSGGGAAAQVVAAEAAGRGRSPYAHVAAGSESVTLDLVLAPVAALEGTVTRGGKPAAGVHVLAQGGASAAAAVTTAADGGYRFDALPPGNYRVMILLTGTGGGSRVADRRVDVVTGVAARVDVDFAALGVTLIVRPSGVEAAQVVLTREDPAATELHLGLVTGGAPVRLEEVAPGAWTLCGVVASAVGQLQPEELAGARCRAITVTDAPALQELELFE